TAIGLSRSYAQSEDIRPVHVALAAYTTMRVDEAVQNWNTTSRMINFGKKDKPPGSQEGQEAHADESSGPNQKADKQKRAGSKKIEEAKKNLNQHETKLLTGVADSQNIRTGFDDVHATPETIEALKTLTTLSLMRPEAFSYGVLASDRLPGLMLYGPPGTGKTLLAKAVAKESGATVLEISGAQIYEKYVGEGEKMVRAVFSLAKKLSPCVVFIDEADAIFGSRSGAGNRNTHREIINQFLREWDGMDDHGVFMMVASNRPFDLDDAVLRRLPRRLLVDLPVAKDRESILGIHLKNEALDD
ncbi:AAA-domain-containing protein, partial [Hortaea werneckii]